MKEKRKDKRGRKPMPSDLEELVKAHVPADRKIKTTNADGAIRSSRWCLAHSVQTSFNGREEKCLCILCLSSDHHWLVGRSRKREHQSAGAKAFFRTSSGLCHCQDFYSKPAWQCETGTRNRIFLSVKLHTE